MGTENMLWFFGGLVFGTVVGGCNHWLVWRVIKTYENMDPAKAKTKLMIRYIIRYFVNVLVLFLVYKNLWLLFGTAIGLTLMQKAIALKFSFFKKGVS